MSLVTDTVAVTVVVIVTIITIKSLWYKEDVLPLRIRFSHYCYRVRTKA